MRSTKNEFMAAEIRFSYSDAHPKFQISSSESANYYFKEIWDDELLPIQEQFYAIYLNSAGAVICWRCLNTGKLNSCHPDVKLLLSIGLNCLASSVIIAHNHPSGQTKPSKPDNRMTLKLKDVCQMIDMPLYDHLIITKDSYYSYRDHDFLLHQWTLNDEN